VEKVENGVGEKATVRNYKVLRTTVRGIISENLSQLSVSFGNPKSYLKICKLILSTTCYLRKTCFAGMSKGVLQYQWNLTNNCSWLSDSSEEQTETSS